MTVQPDMGISVQKKIYPKELKEADIVLIGVDVGTNGDRLSCLTELGEELQQEAGASHVMGLIDHGGLCRRWTCER